MQLTIPQRFGTRLSTATAFTRREPVAVVGRDWQLYYVALTSFVAGALVLYYSYIHNFVLAYNDAQSHLKIARRVFDNRTPGFVQLGTVWLPVPHILLLPFIAVPKLWHTGLAGAFVGLICLVITCIALFLSIRLMTGSNLVGWLGVLVLLSNPNLMYIQTTALTEPTLLMAMTTSSYFLLKWARDERTTQLLIAGVLAALAVGSRYDGWFFAFASIFAVALTILVRTKNPTRVEGYTLAYAIIPAYAVGLYLLYNWIYFGDALSFQRSAFSAQFAQLDFEAKGLLPTKNHLLVSLKVYSWNVVDVDGWVVVILGLIGLLAYIAVTKFRPESFVTYTFLSVYPFNVLALYAGQTVIQVKQLPPVGVFNVRYALGMLPAFAIFIAFLAYLGIRKYGKAVVLPLFALALIVQCAQWIPGWPRTSVDVLEEGLSNQSGSGDVRLCATYLNQYYDGGGILVDDSKNTILTIANMPIKEYIATFNTELWRTALRDPTPYARWVVFNKYLADDILLQTAKANPDFLKNYTVVYDTGQIAVYKRTVDL